MVFFTCNRCGDSVKKPSVEKHYNTKCRGAVVNISCMDCLKDFHGEEYVAHTKCISEMQKYSGKDYVEKEAKNSGAKKQESWMDIIRSILETSEYNLSKQARSAFQRLQSVDNVPRKKAKFQNFVANCMKMPKAQSEEVWNVLEKELEKMKQARANEAIAAKDAQVAAKKVKEDVKHQNGATKRAASEEQDDEVVESAKNKSKKNTSEDQNGNTSEPTKKKSKKHKPAENGQTVNTTSNTDCTAIEPEKKKSKKQKPSENGTTNNSNTAGESMEVAAVAGKKVKEVGKQQNGSTKREASEEQDDKVVEPAKKKSKKNTSEVQNGNTIESAKKKSKKQKSAENGQTENITDCATIEPEKMKSKKEKPSANGTSNNSNIAAESMEVAAVAADDGDEQFQWSAVMEKIIGKNSGGVAIENLKMKVLKKYKTKLDISDLTEKQQKKFEKKFAKNLKRCTSVQVDGDVVKSC